MPVFSTRLLRGAAFATALLALPAATWADVRVLLGVDPADSASNVLLSAALAPSQSLGRALGSATTITQTSTMADVLRATRTVENELIIAPAHATASATLHQYKLLATSGQEQTYVLVARNDVAGMDKLAGKRIYLPQQDSLRSYVAKGLLTDSGVKLAGFSKVIYGNTSGGGLVALSFDMADVTVADEAQAKQWLAENPGKARILKTTRPVPGGMSLVVRKDFCEQHCAQLAAWVNSPDGVITGVGRFKLASADTAKQFTYVASLGITTPDALKGARRVSAEEVAELAKASVSIVDTRTAKEFESEHVRGAISVPYVEKSLKEIDFDASKDDFSALAKLPKDRPTVFLCNGPECWKSYKASKAAVAAGFSKVYWFRGGMPEWREKRMPVEGQAGAALAQLAPAQQAAAKTIVATR
jgi:rhodanese-related sulfurtransferase